MKTELDAIRAVDELNEEYFQQTNDESNAPYGFHYYSVDMGITFFDQTVWDNVDNNVKYQDGIYREETIKECVIRNVRKFQKKIKLVKL
jgi:hypothetical protein